MFNIFPATRRFWIIETSVENRPLDAEIMKAYRLVVRTATRQIRYVALATSSASALDDALTLFGVAGVSVTPIKRSAPQ